MALALGLGLRHHPGTAFDDVAVQNEPDYECDDAGSGGPTGLECLYTTLGAWQIQKSVVAA